MLQGNGLGLLQLMKGAEGRGRKTSCIPRGQTETLMKIIPLRHKSSRWLKLNQKIWNFFSFPILYHHTKCSIIVVKYSLESCRLWIPLRNRTIRKPKAKKSDKNKDTRESWSLSYLTIKTISTAKRPASWTHKGLLMPEPTLMEQIWFSTKHFKANRKASKNTMWKHRTHLNYTQIWHRCWNHQTSYSK